MHNLIKARASLGIWLKDDDDRRKITKKVQIFEKDIDRYTVVYQQSGGSALNWFYNLEDILEFVEGLRGEGYKLKFPTHDMSAFFHEDGSVRTVFDKLLDALDEPRVSGLEKFLNA